MNAKEERHVWSNTTLLTLGEGVGQVANFVFVVLIARVFGAVVLGHYALAMAVGGLAAILVSFGSVNLIVRAIGRSPAAGSRIRAVLAPFQWLIAVALMLATLILVEAWFDDRMVATVVVAVMGHHLLNRLTTVQLAEAMGRERMAFVAAVTAGQRVAIAVLATVSLQIWPERLEMFYAMPLVAALMWAVAVAVTQRMPDYARVRWSPAEAWMYARQCRPFLSLVILSTFYARSGVVLLTAFAGAAAVGAFVSGERIVAALNMFAVMLASAALPTLSRLQAHDAARAQLLATRCLRLLLLVTVPLATGLCLLAGDLIALVFGAGYEAATPVLAVAAWLLVTRASTGIFTTMAVAASRQEDAVHCQALGLLVLLIAAAVLIPNFGAVGLAVALLLAEIAQASLLYRCLHRAGSNPRLPGLVAICATAVVLVLVDQLVSTYALPVRAAALAASALCTMFALRGLTGDDLRWALRLLRGGEGVGGVGSVGSDPAGGR